jgi:hypothetical protein
MSGVSGGSLGLAAFAGSLAVAARTMRRRPARSAPSSARTTWRRWSATCCTRTCWRASRLSLPQLRPLAGAGRRLAARLGAALRVDEGGRLVHAAAAGARPRGRRPAAAAVQRDLRQRGPARGAGNLAFLPPQAYDLFAGGPGDAPLDTSRITLAQAVHNSARFPYISPAALVSTTNGEPWDYLVDGGYFENSGAATLNAMIAEILKLGVIKPEQLVVLVIENEPASQSQWICPTRAQMLDAVAGPARPPLKVGVRLPWQPRLRPGDKVVPPVPELSLPFFTLYQTRNARAQAAEEETTRLLGGCGAGRVIELRYPWTAEGRQPPLSWFLNGGTTRAMAGMLQRRESEAPEVGRLPGELAADPAHGAGRPARRQAPL